MMKYELSRRYQPWSLPLPNESQKPGKWWAWHAFPSWCCLGNGAGMASPLSEPWHPLFHSPPWWQRLSALYLLSLLLQKILVCPQWCSLPRSVPGCSSMVGWGFWALLCAGLPRGSEVQLSSLCCHCCPLRAHPALLSLCLPSHCPGPDPACTKGACCLQCFWIPTERWLQLLDFLGEVRFWFFLHFGFIRREKQGSSPPACRMWLRFSFLKPWVARYS